jgi:DNA polymerase IV
VRFSDFRTISRSRTLPDATDTAHEMFAIAWELFGAAGGGERIRLLGVRLEGLVASEGRNQQLMLGQPAQGWREAEVASDAIAARFGRGAVRPASLLGGPDPSRSQNPAPGTVVPLSDPPSRS